MTTHEPGPSIDFFVAVPLNHEQILKHPGLPALVARSVAELLDLVLLRVVCLTPGQPPQALGAEVLALGVVLLLGVMMAMLRGFENDTTRT